MSKSPRSRQLAALAVSGVLIAVISGCAGSSTSGDGDAASTHPGTVTWVRPAASDGWEGDRCNDLSIQLNPAVYDTLLRVQVPDGDGLAPGLAKTWKWDAASKSYTFEIRDNAAFSNGKPVTADDVVFSVQQWVNGPISGSYYANVDKAVAVDEHTVRIDMKQTDTFLPDLLTWCTSPIYPANFGGMSKKDYFNKPIGAGPYQVETYDDPQGTSEKIGLVPNPHYWGWEGDPPLEKVNIEAVSDPSQRVLMFESGEADMVDRVDPAMSSSLDPSSLVSPKLNQIEVLQLNVTKGPLMDPDVRKAISLALDRKTLADTLNNGDAAAEGFLPVNVPGGVPATTPYTFDLDGAKASMAASQYADGFSIKLLYDKADKTVETMAQVVQSQLKEIGITIDLETTDSNTQYARLDSGDYEMTFTGASAISPTIFDPISYMTLLWSWTGDPSTFIQDEFLKGTSTTDAKLQERAASDVQDYVMTNNNLIGLVNSAKSFAVHPWVKGFQPLQYDTFYFDTLSN